MYIAESEAGLVDISRLEMGTVCFSVMGAQYCLMYSRRGKRE